MNIDTVETQTSSQVTEAATAEEIAANYNCQEWGYGVVGDANWNAEHVAITSGAARGAITDFKSSINEWFAIDNTTINGQTRPTILMTKPASEQKYTHKVFIDSQNYVTVTKGTDFEATYETTFGASDRLNTTNVCGEAYFWFKLDEKSENGFGICFDNHTGCGFFASHNDTAYMVKMVNGVVYVIDSSKYIGRFVDFKYYPEYKLKVTEVNGVATVEITPANSVAGVADGLSGTDIYSTANNNKITWQNINVEMYDTPFTQAYGFYYFGGLYFADSSVTMKRTITKSFGDIVYEPQWTDGALHMLINMDTAADSTMLGSDGGL